MRVGFWIAAYPSSSCFTLSSNCSTMSLVSTPVDSPRASSVQPRRHSSDPQHLVLLAALAQSCVAQTPFLTGRVDGVGDAHGVDVSRRRPPVYRYAASRTSSVVITQFIAYALVVLLLVSRFFRRPTPCARPRPCAARRRPVSVAVPRFGVQRQIAVAFHGLSHSKTRVPTNLGSSRTSGCHAKTRPNLWCLDAKANVRAAFSRSRARDRAPPPTGRVDASSSAFLFCRSFSTASSSLDSSARSNLSSTSFLVEARSDFF